MDCSTFINSEKAEETLRTASGWKLCSPIKIAYYHPRYDLIPFPLSRDYRIAVQ